MNLKTKFLFFVSLISMISSSDNAFCASRLSPQDFNKMYYIAKLGRVDILRNAVNRGLNINTVNQHGDTGLCIAIKRKDFVAFETFRKSGANPNHPCTYKIRQQYIAFLEKKDTKQQKQVLKQHKSLYYPEDDTSIWPWILGGLAIGGGALAFSGGDSSSYTPTPVIEENISPVVSGHGLATLLSNYDKKIINKEATNSLNIDVRNSLSENIINKIKLIPNTLDNFSSLHTYTLATNNGTFINNGILSQFDGTIGLSATGKNSAVVNNNEIKIDSSNGSIGLVASNNANATNNENATINITYQGTAQGSAIIGMYADTASTIENHGTITGTAVSIPTIETQSLSNISPTPFDVVINQDGSGSSTDTSTGEGENEETPEEEENEEEVEVIVNANSGTILGMGVFDFYTGTNFSSQIINAINNGNITLSAGYNSLSDASVSLIGMGSFLDDNFLYGTSNPNFAEQMLLTNNGDINLSYQGKYSLSESGLKLGDGGLIGIRADGSTTALNKGNINIDLRSTNLTSGVDVASGMLSVHGADLTNSGTISILNEATSGGVSYGMLSAPGDGSQTRVHKFKTPKLTNEASGVIDLQMSNSYAMASFAGGSITNNGIINLGTELGDSKYTNNYGLYAAGTDKTSEVSLVNNGIINVNSTKSTAIKNDFAGSVELINNGTIYLSNKASDSKVFDGNFSKATNNGIINYKVDNSYYYFAPDGLREAIDRIFQIAPIASIIAVSPSDNINKQTFENFGTINLGAPYNQNIDYGGTHGTAVVYVYRQGSAFNRGIINIDEYEADADLLNVGMHIDKVATAGAYVENHGTINVGANNSVGIRNDSQHGGTARNFNKINVNGKYSVGMSSQSTNGAIFNGSSTDNKNAIIDVNGYGSVGIYLQNGLAYNYGTINLNADKSIGYYVSEGSHINIHGIINHTLGLKDIIYYVVTKQAELYFDSIGTINGFTLAKALGGNGSAKVEISKDSDVTVTGSNSHLIIAEKPQSEAHNHGHVNVKDGATAIIALDGGNAYNSGASAILNIDENSIGLYASKNNATITNDASATINVNDGIGLKANDTGLVYNYGRIYVNKGIGILVSDGAGEIHSTAENLGDILISGKDAIGIKSTIGGVFTNETDATIEVKGPEDLVDTDILDKKGYAYGIHADGDTTNNGAINVKQNSIGIYSTRGKLTNEGIITVNHENSYGIYSTNELPIPENNGDIRISKGIGVFGKITNSGNINVTGLLDNDHSAIGVKGYLINEGGKIDVKGKGVALIGQGENHGQITSASLNENGAIQIKGNFINAGMISGSGLLINLADNSYFTNTNIGSISLDSGTVFLQNGGTIDNSGSISGTGTGAIVNKGTFTNNGNIIIGTGSGIYINGENATAINAKYIQISSGTGMYINGGTGTNSKDITVTSGTGMYINGGTGTNSGNITVSSGTGMHINEGTGTNSGNITISNDGTGMFVASGATASNTGTIEFNSDTGGSCGNVGGTCIDHKKEEKAQSLSLSPSIDDIIKLEENAIFINSGTVETTNSNIDFGNNSNYIIAKNGTFNANSFKGNITASTDITQGSFYNIYKNQDSFIGKDEGINISSQSYMFNASLEKNKDNNIDVKLERKSFDDLLDDKELANFFETNYTLENNVKMFDSLKSATNQKEFNNITNQETGKSFYSNLPRENMAVMRILNNQNQSHTLNNGINKTNLTANYHRTSKDGIDNLSSYEDDIFSASLNFGTRLSSNLSIGANLTGAFVKSTYDDINSERENKIIMAFIPIMYQNNKFKHLTTPSIGVGFGSYERYAPSSTYDADTFDIYYGLYNHSEYNVDLKVLELVYEAELNLQGISSDDADENNGLTLKSNNTLSLEAGIGLKLRKQIELAKNRSLTLSIGTKYYHEFLDPYESLKIGINNSTFTNKAYNEDKNRLKTTAEAIYKDGDLSINAELSHNQEKESNIEGGLGIHYNF